MTWLSHRCRNPSDLAVLINAAKRPDVAIINECVTWSSLFERRQAISAKDVRAFVRRAEPLRVRLGIIQRPDRNNRVFAAVITAVSFELAAYSQHIWLAFEILKGRGQAVIFELCIANSIIFLRFDIGS